MTAIGQVVYQLGTGLVEAGTAVVTADDLGLTRGDGVFDATRVVTTADGHSTVDHLDLHLDRLGRSLAGLDVDFTAADRADWERAIAEAVTAWTVPGEAIGKLIWTRGQESASSEPTRLFTITPISAQALADRERLSVVTLARGTSSQLFHEVPWLLGGVKSLSYAVNMAAKREAARRGATEVIFISSDGYVLEGPNAAVLVWDGQQLITTPADGTGILPSITQRLIFDAAEAAGIATCTRLIRPDELLSAQGVWLASSVRGVAPVAELDGTGLAVDNELTATMRGWINFPT